MKIYTLSLICFFVFTAVTVKAQSLQLLPIIPEAEKNIHIAKAFEGVKPATVPIISKDWFKNADETLIAAYAYLHPSSPYKGKKEILDRLSLLLDHFFGQWTQDQNLGDMSFNFHVSVTYLMLKTYEPTSISTEKKELWEKAIEKNIAKILTNKDLYEKHIVGSVWLNGDIRIAMGGYFGALVLNDTAKATIFKSAIEDCMTQTLLPDGGTHYVGYQNESPSYHGGATIKHFMWYYILTGSPKIKQWLFQTKNYIPLMWSTTGRGFHEWSTSPAWKPYYNPSNMNPEALATAYLTGDGYNYTIGKGSQDLYLAFLYRSGLHETALPDKFMLYDKNTFGARGRFGGWGLQATTRDVSRPLPELHETPLIHMDGINTFVGAYVLNENAAKEVYPLNAAFQGAAPQVKIKKGVETDFSRGNKWAFLTAADIKTAVTKSWKVYGVSAENVIAGRSFKPTDWMSEQEWILTPDRLIGLTTVKSVKETTAFGLAQRLAFTSGRLKVTGTKKTLVAKSDNTAEYGDLLVKVHDQNYKGTMQVFEYGTMNAPEDTYSTMVVIHDSLDKQTDEAIRYPAGYERMALVEVIDKKSQTPSKAAVLALPQGLRGFSCTDEKRSIAIIHNITEAPISYQSSFEALYKTSKLLYSWDASLATLLSIQNKKTQLPATVIPPHGHLLVVNSNDPNDFEQGYQTFNTIFPDPAPVPYFPFQVFDFKKKTANKRTTLSWQIKDTAHCTGFELLKSNDGKLYSVIAIVKPTTNNAFSYSYTDTQNGNTKAYYKLMWLDAIGQSNEIATLPE